MTEKEKIESALMVVGHLEEMLNGQYHGDFQTIRGLLKKQIPMKVEEIHVDEYFCPACGSQSNCGDICLIGDRYCPECGQALYQEN